MDLLRSLPIGLYLEQPITWLHQLDPRVKLAWLMTFLVIPLLANPLWRIAVVGLLIVITLTAKIPWRVWRQQIGWLMVLSIWVLILASFAPDGLDTEYQPRLPADELGFVQKSLPEAIAARPWYNPFGWGEKTNNSQPKIPEPKSLIDLPQPTSYRYILFQKGPLRISRHSLDMAIRISTLLFTLIYSTNLYLLTTAPEEITAGLESLMLPLKRLNWPITEIILTLTLSLRFIPLVLEEIQNLVRSVQTRAINWQKLGFRKALQVWMLVAVRLLENLLLRAEQIASAMQVRGFTSPNQHRVQWYKLSLKIVDWLSLAFLGLVWGVRILWGGESFDLSSLL